MDKFLFALIIVLVMIIGSLVSAFYQRFAEEVIEKHGRRWYILVLIMLPPVLVLYIAIALLLGN